MKRLPAGRRLPLPLGDQIRQTKEGQNCPGNMSPVTCHLSSVTCHLSPVLVAEDHILQQWTGRSKEPHLEGGGVYEDGDLGRGVEEVVFTGPEAC